MEILTNILILIAGFVILIKGADFFVDGSIGVAQRFGIPHLIIGLTIVSMGTSAPEAAVSISSALKGIPDITIGNVVGSNIFNILMILGFTAMVSPLVIKYAEMKKQIQILSLISVAFMGFGMYGEIGLLGGIVLSALFIAFLSMLVRDSKVTEIPDEPDVIEEKNIVRSMPKDIILIVVGLAMIIIGSQLAVDSATELAVIMGVSQRFIGLTIVAFGTSLPELATSVVAAMKGNSDIAIGNIVGSNIFNILFVCGITALITPIPFNSQFVIDSAIALFAAAALIPLGRKGILGRKTGALFVLAYAAYFVTLLY
ncbi:MAG: calcium/sodium antiporter [Clostridia bacterium]|nr:calcium/sodium antiporter [Clostridia bacterium]